MIHTYESCRAGVSATSCNFAVFCTYTDATLWCFVLLPQIHKNFREKSVDGLSVLWSTAFFTASIVNSFYVFHVKLPVYFCITTVTVAVISVVVLVQFWSYSKELAALKVYYAGGCVILWTAIVTLEFALNVKETAAKIQWLALVLWSVLLFPQTAVNIRLRRTSGQSTPAVAITLVAKIFEFLGHSLLALPHQYLYMTYFSSTLACINGMQVIWYPKPQQQSTTIPQVVTYGSHQNRDEDPLDAVDVEPLIGDTDSVTGPAYTEEEIATVHSLKQQRLKFKQRIKKLPKYQLALMVIMAGLLVIFEVSLCANLHSGIALLAPLPVILGFVIVFLCRAYREGQLTLLNPVISWFGDCCCADSPVQATW
ncbi:predicted protein [Nematostella vectensis]|uniref:Uncharacterized protein n=1 Tax=Nematostella vectensis TaxID=45351 RepID=A7RVE2_NEMVE|nr:uncharacterized protein LOC5516565 isoform X1 [Nematostella vectensis]EDO44625.1 predicted protein [Nematostella vectensis]|eukprot:XP_001636688.1 predicted protein [Nematostella vectensis]